MAMKRVPAGTIARKEAQQLLEAEKRYMERRAAEMGGVPLKPLTAEEADKLMKTPLSELTPDQMKQLNHYMGGGDIDPSNPERPYYEAQRGPGGLQLHPYSEFLRPNPDQRQPWETEQQRLQRLMSVPNRLAEDREAFREGQNLADPGNLGQQGREVQDVQGHFPPGFKQDINRPSADIVGQEGTAHLPGGDSFRPDYLILHDYGGKKVGQNPYHTLVFPDGSVRYRNPENPYGQPAEHSHKLNARSIGLAYADKSGAQPTPAGMEALRREYGKVLQQFPNIQTLSHGEAFDRHMKGEIPERPSVEGRGPNEAIWRNELRKRGPAQAAPAGQPQQSLAQWARGEQPSQAAPAARTDRMFPVPGIRPEDVPHHGNTANSRDFLGPRGGGRHAGLDIPGKVGSAVISPGNGTLVKTGFDKGGYGNFMDIRLSDGTIHRLGHLNDISSKLSAGSEVKMGQQVATLGYTGNADKGFPHVHYEVFPNERRYGEAAGGSSRALAHLRIDPREYHKGGGASDVSKVVVDTSKVSDEGGKFLSDRRQRFADEMNGNLELKKMIAATANLEAGTPDGRTAVVESLYNRMDYTKQSLNQGLYGGFYSPIKDGRAAAEKARLEKDPRAMAEAMGNVNRALSSNLTRGNTDQGMYTDTNFHAGGTGIEIKEPGGTNRFNDFGGGPGGHAGARAYREQLQVGYNQAAARRGGTPAAPQSQNITFSNLSENMPAIMGGQRAQPAAAPSELPLALPGQAGIGRDDRYPLAQSPGAVGLGRDDRYPLTKTPPQPGGGIGSDARLPLGDQEGQPGPTTSVPAPATSQVPGISVASPDQTPEALAETTLANINPDVPAPSQDYTPAQAGASGGPGGGPGGASAVSQWQPGQPIGAAILSDIFGGGGGGLFGGKGGGGGGFKNQVTIPQLPDLGAQILQVAGQDANVLPTTLPSPPPPVPPSPPGQSSYAADMRRRRRTA